MTTAQLSMIAPPPSVEAVLGALTEETRIGQVDFSTRLAPEPEEEPDEVGMASGGAEDDLDDESGDVLEEDQADEDEDDEQDEPEVEMTARVVTLVSVPRTHDDETDDRAGDDEAGDDEADQDGDDGAGQDEAEADDEETGADQPVAEDELEDETPATREPVAAEAPSPLEARIHAPATLRDFQEPALRAEADERPPTVEEIARLVIERMQDAELSMMRHLEAIEAEAARRAELLTAQAELDAELIRLNARREAHSIVTAARVRAGEPAAAEATEDRRLDELAESLSRFAEVVDELRPAGARTVPWGRTP